MFNTTMNKWPQIAFLFGSFRVSQQMNSKLFTDLEYVWYYAHNKSAFSSMNAPLSFWREMINCSIQRYTPFRWSQSVIIIKMS